MAKTKRHQFDFYPTPEGHVEAALELLPHTPEMILDAGAGTGAWGTVARRLWREAWICGVEVQPLAMPTAYNTWCSGSFLELDVRPREFDTVISNPPYALAEPFVRKAMTVASRQVVMLLRLGFLEGQARHKGLWAEFPPKLVAVYGDRPSFKASGLSDSQAYAAFVWQQGFQGDPTLRFILSTRARPCSKVQQGVLFDEDTT